LLRVRVDPRKRIMPEHDPQSRGDVALQVAKDSVQTAAIWTLIISILYECVGGILWSVHVVRWTYWKEET